MAYQEEEEQPLDPVMERVRKKMIRLMVISIGIMMVGLLAVLFAVIYKVSNGSSVAKEEATTPPAGTVVETNLELPVGAKIISSTVEDGRLVVHITKSDGSVEFLIVDTKSGALVSRITSR